MKRREQSLMFMLVSIREGTIVLSDRADIQVLLGRNISSIGCIAVKAHLMWGAAPY